MNTTMDRPNDSKVYLTPGEHRFMVALIRSDGDFLAVESILGIRRCTVRTHTANVANKLDSRSIQQSLIRYLRAYPEALN